METLEKNKNRRVLVTGSSRGLGAAIATSLANEGYQLTLHCRGSRELAEELASSLPNQERAPTVLQFDVADRDAARAALEADVEAHDAFYGVVLNAGLHRDLPFAGYDDDDWDEIIRVNLDGFYNVLRPLSMPMIQKRIGGRIVVMSSLAGVVGNRGQVNYSAAKAGLIGATKALSKELAKRRITVNCVAPGFIESDMTEAIPAEHIRSLVPMQRAGRPEEVAALVRFLFEENAEYITGQVVSINGGVA